MERYRGIDVHRDSSTVVVLSASGKRSRRDVVQTNGHELVRYLKQLRGSLHVCIEESPWSEWLYEILSPHVAELVVFQNEWSPGPKSDAIDAHGLAEKLRLGQAGPGVFKAYAGSERKCLSHRHLCRNSLQSQRVRPPRHPIAPCCAHCVLLRRFERQCTRSAPRAQSRRAKAQQRFSARHHQQTGQAAQRPVRGFQPPSCEGD